MYKLSLFLILLNASAALSMETVQNAFRWISPGTVEDLGLALIMHNDRAISFYLESVQFGYMDISKLSTYPAKKAFIWTASRGKTEILKTLVTMPSIDINAHDEYGATALILAAANGHLETTKTLLATPNSDINAKDSNGGTALMWAAVYKRLEVIKTLLAVPNIDINAQDKNGHTALIFAATKGNLEAVQILLTIPNIDINALNKDGHTALISAASIGYSEIIKTLSAAGASIDGLQSPSEDVIRAIQTGKALFTQIFYAMKSGNTEMLAQYITDGLTLNIRDSKGNGAMHIAFDSNDITEDDRYTLIKFLYRYNPGLVTIENNNGETPLARALLLNGSNGGGTEIIIKWIIQAAYNTEQARLRQLKRQAQRQLTRDILQSVYVAMNAHAQKTNLRI